MVNREGHVSLGELNQMCSLYGVTLTLYRVGTTVLAIIRASDSIHSPSRADEAVLL